jgi:hypothetical protein
LDEKKKSFSSIEQLLMMLPEDRIVPLCTVVPAYQDSLPVVDIQIAQ